MTNAVNLASVAPSLSGDGSTFKFDSGYGSVATAYGCRAWVNFNGTGTVAIRSSGNVSSITDLGTGQYRVNFSTSMPDTNYSVVISVDSNRFPFFGAFATGSVEVYNFGPSAYADPATMCVSVFR